MQVQIIMGSIVNVLTANNLLLTGAQAVNGPIAAPSSAVGYARPVEEVWRKGSGGARMFEKGIAKVQPTVGPTLAEAIPRGAGAVGQAKAKIRAAFLTEIKAGTPVRTGRLRASITDLSASGSSPIFTSNTPISNIAGRVTTRFSTRRR